MTMMQQRGNFMWWSGWAIVWLSAVLALASLIDGFVDPDARGAMAICLLVQGFNIGSIVPRLRRYE